jgi:t-SNARE complex subunit (syntaxin)
MTALQNYTQAEKDYRQKQRARVERQFKIGQSRSFTEVGRNGTNFPPLVKPDATAEEVTAVVDNTGSASQIFSTAVRA